MHAEAISDPFHYPWYAGVIGGYGATTWNGLVATDANKNLAINMSTPTIVHEGGGVWGFLAGYEFLPAFALEANYMHYADATVFFDASSLFSFMNQDLTRFLSSTETLSLMGKIMLVVPKADSLRLFSSVGVAGVHRTDMLVDAWRASPVFGAGLNYHVTDYLMGELAATYTAGYGESQLSPADSYFPFLYAVSARLAYYF